MTGFNKFDPHAFLERERLAQGRSATLATLATLAAPPLNNENRESRSLPHDVDSLPRGESGGDKLGLLARRNGGQRCEPGKNQSLTPTPAKAAKVAKAHTAQNFSDFSDPPAAFDALALKCPDLVLDDRWRQAVEDGRQFLAAWGEQAHAFGWTAKDLFGLHPVPERPAASYRRLSRYDETGLIWLLRGRPVVALSETTAAIQGATSILTYRKQNRPALGPLGDSLDDLGPCA